MPIHPIAVVDRVIDEYRDYLLTEFRAKDEGLRDELKRALQEQGFLAQEPFFQAYRPFKEGKPWHALGLDKRIAKALEKRSGSKTSFLHQSEAITHLLGKDASPLAVTTGTGSGKSECFLVPVLQNAIDDASRFSRDGLTAILIYPMNALATDQEKRIREYLDDSGHTAIRVERYDRTTSAAKREEMRRKPPHVLLTNYMMLEYLLVRPADRENLFKNHRCRFIVLDEVHTYRGSLGTNIALLFRRLREHLHQATQDWAIQDPTDARRFPKPLVIATSATIKSADETQSEELRQASRKAAVQEFLKTMTGFPGPSFRVLGEERQSLTVPGDAAWPDEPVAIDPPRHGDAEAVRRAIVALAGLPDHTPVNKAAPRAKILFTLGEILSQKPLPLSGLVEAVLRDVPERRNKPRDAVEREIRTALSAGISLRDDVHGVLRLRASIFARRMAISSVRRDKLWHAPCARGNDLYKMRSCRSAALVVPRMWHGRIASPRRTESRRNEARTVDARRRGR